MFIIYILFILYFIFLLWLSNNSSNLDTAEKQNQPFQFVSVIIAVRNESNNIKKLIDSFKSQTYNKNLYEVIIVDDSSTDDTCELFEINKDVNMKMIKSKYLNDDYDRKIHALKQGVKLAKGDIILHTDGDCYVSENWISKMSFELSKSNIGIACSFTPLYGSGFLNNILQLESMAQDALCALSFCSGLVFSCNGRSFGYRKKYYESVKGYDGIDNVKGGDDDLLLHKIVFKEHCNVKFLIDRDTFVWTAPPRSLRSLIMQRLRYASKGFQYYKFKFISKELKLILPFLYIVNFISCVSLIYLCNYPKLNLFIILLIKFYADFIMIYIFSKKIDYKINFISYFFLSMVHPFYIVITSSVAPFYKFKWK